MNELISRKSAKNAIYKVCLSEGNEDIFVKILDEINKLPSVNPQEPKYCDRNICIQNEYNGIGCDECEVTKSQEPKPGHWSHDGSHWKNRFICSECGYKLFDEQTNYCPDCGAKMVEPQESEEG